MKQQSKFYEIRKEFIVGMFGIIFLLMTAVGWLIQTQYFEKRNQHETYLVEEHKKLYEEGSLKIKNLRNAYEDITSLLTQNYGATPIEIKKAYENFNQAKKDLEDYDNKLARYSFDEMIIPIDNINKVVQYDAQFIWLHQENSKRVHKAVATVLYETNPLKPPKANEALVTKIKEAAAPELYQCINLENMVYFRLRHYSLPLITGLESSFNYNFRKFLDLGTNEKVEEEISLLPDLLSKWKKYEYKDKKAPYAIASFRNFAAPELTIEDKLKDDYEQSIILMKFIMAASIDLYYLDKKTDAKKAE